MTKQTGFTLIELLVVIAIIGILMGIAVVALDPNTLFGRGRDGRRMSDLSAIQAALEAYYAQNASYPVAPLPAPGSPLTDGTVTYLKSMPDDPDPSKNYSYAVSGANYEICADVDAATPPDSCDYTTPLYGASGDCCLTNPF